MKAERALRRITPGLTVAMAVVLVGAGACSSSSGKQTSGSAKQTISITLQGLGAETTETEKQIKEFEAANPNITVNPVVLSPDANTLNQQLSQRFVAGDQPDVIISDVAFVAKYAQAGWLLPLDQFSPNTSDFFPAQVKTTQFNGHTYGMPWFSNAEGLYYRKDLVPTPPKSLAELVSDAKAAMSKDSTLKEGLAFEGDKYEGSITAFQAFEGTTGGTLDPANINTPANQQALQAEQDTIYKDKIAPTAVTGWQEQQVENAWTSGQTVFAINWPYMIADSAKVAALNGKVGFTTFPGQNGQPGAASLGGDDLVISKDSKHQAAAYKLIQFLDTPAQQIERAVATGDAPALTSAFNQDLFSKASYFSELQPVFQHVVNRPVTGTYSAVSDALQTMISTALSNQSSGAAAVSKAASAVKSAASGSGS